jgi:hypothetical protein
VFVSFFNGHSDTSTVSYLILDKKISALIRLKEPVLMHKTGAMQRVLIVGNRTVCLSCPYISYSNIFKIELKGINIIVECLMHLSLQGIASLTSMLQLIA